MGAGVEWELGEQDGGGEVSMNKAQLKVLSAIYMATDCSNEVYDWAILHWKQERIADGMSDCVQSIDGCVAVDGDGFMADPERYGRGFRLTQRGYEALTASYPQRYPQELRRFAAITATNPEVTR